MENDVVLSVRDLVVRFTLRGQTLTAVRGASIDLHRGESLAIVGESGSGKSVFTKSFMGMLDNNGRIDGGSILFDGEDIAKYKTEKEWLRVRGKRIAMVFQDPMTALSPLMTVGRQIAETLTLHQGLRGKAAKARAIEILRDVGITDPERRYKQYPHEFSGGMRQRVVIAIAVVHLGKIVELADTETLYRHPLHPYTRALLSAVPMPNPELERSKKLLVYDPSVHDYSTELPEFVEIEPGHFVYGNRPELDGYREKLANLRD